MSKHVYADGQTYETNRRNSRDKRRQTNGVKNSETENSPNTFKPDGQNKSAKVLPPDSRENTKQQKWQNSRLTKRTPENDAAGVLDGGLDDGSITSDTQDQATSGSEVQRTKEANVVKEGFNKQLISYFVKLAKKDEIDLKYVDKLLHDGADINCRDKHGQGLLHEVARKWPQDILEFLLERGADIDIKDRLRRTPLHIAAAVDRPTMVELLIDGGCDIEAQTTECQTPLHYAARYDAASSLEVLLAYEAEMETKDHKGRTPLFVAAELDRSVAAKYLLEEGADASVINNYNQLCLTFMIINMGPVSVIALDQFHHKDRANRKQYFRLSRLESETCLKPEKQEILNQKNRPKADTLVKHLGGSGPNLAKNPLEVIVQYRQLELIMHPVIKRLIDVKWEQFGRRTAIIHLVQNFVFNLIWTILGVGVPWYVRNQYNFPQDAWRVVLLVLGCCMTLYFVVLEIKEIVLANSKFVDWQKWRKEQIKHDIRLCHPTWKKEKEYLKQQKEKVKKASPSYFKDSWNYFDWAVYSLISLVVITHVIDVVLSVSNPTSPCCNADGPAVSCFVNSCSTGFVNNQSLTTWNNRIFVITIILLWLRLMKFTRAFRFFGPFIVMLGKITWDILRFVYLYLEFYIPYACAFWMIFGNIESIPSMFTVDQMLFSLYRITLVDDYQFDEMRAFDVVMAYILIGTFLGISAILCINLFIALLSDTFQRVYDNAKANAFMQQASLLLSIEENLGKAKQEYTKHIDENCNPESKYYDDDLTIEQGSDLKKVTIQIKEQMNELLTYVRKAETEERHAGLRRLETKMNKAVTYVDGPMSNKDINKLFSRMDKLFHKMNVMSSKLKALQIQTRSQQRSLRELRVGAFEDYSEEHLERLPARLFSAPSDRLSFVSEQALYPNPADAFIPNSLPSLIRTRPSLPHVQSIQLPGTTEED
ncbi:uncharacterized protein LOC143470330 isoform X2 [Clavelina lepadiformis]|uniref:uncharacterized protein LOC143470330 isoform X2 n=1 Tax=Clavelina lepadiformis TaxID=159417 RepID=UPI0040418381